jgi:hypothetical protein
MSSGFTVVKVDFLQNNYGSVIRNNAYDQERCKEPCGLHILTDCPWRMSSPKVHMLNVTAVCTVCIYALLTSWRGDRELKIQQEVHAVMLKRCLYRCIQNTDKGKDG